MAAEGMVQSGRSSPVIRQLEFCADPHRSDRGAQADHRARADRLPVRQFRAEHDRRVGAAPEGALGPTGTDIGFLNTITFGSAAIGRLLSGILGDRYGRRVMLSVNLLLFSLGSAACALAPDFMFLCFARAIVGFGVGGEISTAVTMLSEFCSPKFRGTAAGLVNVGAGGFGNFLAPVYGLMIFSLFPGEESCAGCSPRWRCRPFSSSSTAALCRRRRAFSPRKVVSTRRTRCCRCWNPVRSGRATSWCASI